MTLFKTNLLARFPSEVIILWLLRLMALICGAILLLIVIFLGWKAFPIFSEIGLVKFFTDRSWHPTAGEYNLIPMLLGTILTSLGAILVATPTGIISAIFSHYYAPSAIALIYRRLIELLAGIPSVVYGFWGLLVLVPLIRACWINPEIRSDQGLTPLKGYLKAQKWGKIKQNHCTSLRTTQSNVSKVTAELDK